MGLAGAFLAGRFDGEKQAESNEVRQVRSSDHPVVIEGNEPVNLCDLRFYLSSLTPNEIDRLSANGAGVSG